MASKGSCNPYRPCEGKMMFCVAVKALCDTFASGNIEHTARPN